MKPNLRRHWILFIFMGIFTVWPSVTKVFADQVPLEQTIADKTFVYRNEIWIDTAYEPTQQALYQIGTLSNEYALLERSLPNLRQFRRLGDHFLIVHDGWGIEVVNGRESGPFVSSETRRPAFLNVEPVNYPNALTISRPTDPPTLIATHTNRDGININFHIGWGELAGVIILIGLIGLGIWLGVKEPVSSTETSHIGDG